jgi:hypothetical protein
LMEVLQFFIFSEIFLNFPKKTNFDTNVGD